LRSICIPRSIEMLGQSCFANTRFGLITFEPGSNLGNVHSSCFEGSELSPALLLENTHSSTFQDLELSPDLLLESLAP
jgi:hypothetical protein